MMMIMQSEIIMISPNPNAGKAVSFYDATADAIALKEALSDWESLVLGFGPDRPSTPMTPFAERTEAVGMIAENMGRRWR
jgi:hypothetical protein